MTDKDHLPMEPIMMYHLSESTLIRGGMYRIVKPVLIVERCRRTGCYITDNGLHVSFVYPTYEKVPAPEFSDYRLIEEYDGYYEYFFMKVPRE